MGNNEELGLETNRLEYFRRVLDSTGKGITGVYTHFLCYSSGQL